MAPKRKHRRVPTVSARAPQAIPTPSKGASPWILWWPGLLVFAVAVAVYLNALGNGFVYDAKVLIVDNPRLQQSHEWLAWFRRHYWWGAVENSNLYRPLTVLSWVANLRLAGLHPFSFHLTNILLHGAVSVLVLALGRRLLGMPAALVGALIFAVHPLHTEVVAWIAGRAELLAALFALVASLAFLKSTDPHERRPWVWSAAVVGGYFLSLLSKEHAAPLPVWWALAWWLRNPRAPQRRLLLALAGAAAALGVYLYLRGWVHTSAPYGVGHQVRNPMASPLLDAPLWQRWLTAAAILVRYLGLFLWPARLSIDYSIPQIEPSTGLGALEVAGFLVLAGWLAAFLVAARLAPGLALVLAFVPATYLVASNFVFLLGALMSERFTYLATIGLCLLSGWLLARGAQVLGGRLGNQGRVLLSGDGSKRLLVGVVAVLLVAMATRTIIRNQDWKDDYTAFSAALTVTPRSANVLAILGREELHRGNAERARALLEEAVRYVPEYPTFRIWLGSAYARLDQTDRAIEQYRQAGAMAPFAPEGLHNLGALLWKLGRPDEAEEAYREAVRRRPQFVPSRIDLGWLLHAERKPAEAMEQFRAVLRAAPRHPEALYGAAVVSAALGELAAARDLGRQAEAAGYRVPEKFWRALDQAR